MKKKDILKRIRQICTYHSDDGTSGYELSEKQFEEISELIDTTRIETIEEIDFELKQDGYWVYGGRTNGFLLEVFEKWLDKLKSK